MTLTATISSRISMLRFLLIAIVVFSHIQDPVRIPDVDFSNFLQILRSFTQDQLGRICVPALTLVSGYLLYISNLDLAPARLYAKKAKTLLIPFAVFNICYFAVLAAFEYGLDIAPFSSIKGKSSMAMLNMLFGLTASPLNNTLHFLRELFVLVLLAPLFGVFLRRAPMVGLAVVLTVFMFNFDQHLILRDTMAVMFYVGGMAAIGQWNLLKFDHLAVPCLIALLLLCGTLIALRIENRTLIYITAPILVWPMASLLHGTKFGLMAEKLSKYSFFLFLAHMPVITVLRRVYDSVDHIVPEAVYVYIVPALVIVLLIQVYKILDRVMPRAFALMTGGRTRKTGLVPAIDKKVVLAQQAAQ